MAERNKGYHRNGQTNGAWYLANRHDPRFAGGRIDTYNVQRRGPDYIPFQSMFDTSGRYAYQPGPPAQQYPWYSFTPGSGGYESGTRWNRVRPQEPRVGESVPLGVRGITDQPGYSWDWARNAHGPNGTRYYNPPDREHLTPPPQPARRSPRHNTPRRR